jgi:tRNA modification GTPase
VWKLSSPSTAAGAVAILDIIGDVDAAFARCGLSSLSANRVALRRFMDIDDVLVARWSAGFAQIMPHGGTAVVRAVCTALSGLGIAPAAADPGDLRERHPQARSLVEALMLDALAVAASPMAVDLLLAQPARWAAAANNPQTQAQADAMLRSARDRMLGRLLAPPLVAALGPPNVGKSTLINALAEQRVSIVADEPGTTRDHVGVILDLGGLVVRYMDAPGIHATNDPIERAAIDHSLEMAARADLILAITDVSHEFPLLPEPINSIPRLTVQTRCDCAPGNLACDVRTQGLHAGGDVRPVATAIMQKLVPAALIEDASPWVFWPPKRICRSE